MRFRRHFRGSGILIATAFIVVNVYFLLRELCNRYKNLRSCLSSQIEVNVTVFKTANYDQLDAWRSDRVKIMSPLKKRASNYSPITASRCSSMLLQ